VAEDEESGRDFKERWRALDTGIPLVTLHTEYNSLTAPILNYIERLRGEEDEKELQDPSYTHHLYVVLGEIVPAHPSENLLHNQTAFFLYEQLRAIPEITPIIVRYNPSCLPLVETLKEKNGKMVTWIRKTTRTAVRR